MWNIITSPRSTILGLVGTTSGGAAFLYVMNAMQCNWQDLDMQVLTHAAAMLSAPAVIGGVMKDTHARTAGDDAHDQAGQG